MGLIVMKYIQPDPAIEGWMSSVELDWLFEKASQMETIVEVGSWMGRSIHALLSGCPGTVVAVDHFKGSTSEIDGAHARAKTEDIYEIFKKNVGHFPNLVILKTDSIKASQFFKDKSVDMVFIDGDHEKAKEDFEAWMPKCKKLFCGHDFSQAGVPGAFEELKLNPMLHKGLTIWSIEL